MSAKANSRGKSFTMDNTIQADSHGKTFTILPQDLIDDLEESYLGDEDEVRKYVKAIHKKIVGRSKKEEAAE